MGTQAKRMKRNATYIETGSQIAKYSRRRLDGPGLLGEQQLELR
jgi:hypothetical protein